MLPVATNQTRVGRSDRLFERSGQVSAVGRQNSEGGFAGRTSGTGKTLLAKRLPAKPMFRSFSISGSDFVEMFVGVGASRVRDMFCAGKEKLALSAVYRRD